MERENNISDISGFATRGYPGITIDDTRFRATQDGPFLLHSIGSSKKPAVSDCIERETKQIVDWQIARQKLSACNVDRTHDNMRPQENLGVTAELTSNSYKANPVITTSKEVGIRSAATDYSR